MAKQHNGQSSQNMAHFNQVREEVLNRYLFSYANGVQRRTVIIADNDCCDGKGQFSYVGGHVL